MLASVSPWRLRAVARLLLARRAVARRTKRAGAASGLRSEPWAKTSARGIALVCWSGWGIVSLSSRAIASGTRTGVRLDRADRRRSGSAIRAPTVQASPGVNCRLEPPRSAIASQLGSPPYCQFVFSPRRHLRAFPSLHCRSAEGRGPGDPARSIGTNPPGRWDSADRSPAPAPQSKPVTPASRLVAQETPLVASGLGKWRGDRSRPGRGCARRRSCAKGADTVGRGQGSLASAASAHTPRDLRGCWRTDARGFL